MNAAVLLTVLLAAPPAAAPETDLPTVFSISAATYLSTALVHEGIGHELGCVAGGGRPLGFSTAVAGCDEAGMTPGGRRILKAGGVGANVVVGSGLAAGLLLAPPSDGDLYYAMWLGSVVNLFEASGYLLAGPWFPLGDFGTADGGFVSDLRPRLGWQLGLSGLGLGMTAGTLFLGNRLAEPLLGGDPDVRRSRQWNLTLGPYLLGSGLVTASGLLGRAGPEFAVSAAVATFAGTLFLAYMPLFFSDDFFYPAAQARPGRALSIERSKGFVAGSAAVAILAVAAFGPGIGEFERPHPLDVTRW